MEFLRLSIRQTMGRNGMESRPGQSEIRSPSGQLDITSPSAHVQIRQPNGELHIDSSAALRALALGGPIETGEMLTQQANERAMQAIARIAQKGDRMAQITNKNDAVADLAMNAMEDDTEGLRVTGPASYTNVSLKYIPHAAEIEIAAQHPRIEYTPSRSEINYTPGNLKIYVDQMNSIRMWVSSYDLYA